MSIDVQGGAGGIGARLQDLRSEAGLLDRLGDDVRQWSGAVAGTAVDEDVLAAVLLCPGEVAAVEAAVAAATAGPHGLLVVSTGFETTAVALRASATTYEVVDQANERVLEALGNAAGFGAGLALPALLVGGGLLAAGGGLLLLGRPGGPQLLALLVEKRELLGQYAMRGLHENPWLYEALTRMAPGLVQGGAVSIGTLLAGPVGGLALPVLLSGGKWPTGDYEDAVAGLINAGGRFGLFEDVPGTGEIGDPVPFPATILEERPDGTVVRVPYDAARHAPGSVEDIFMEQFDLYREEDPDNRGQVQIVTRTHPDGTVTHVVQIPGTEEWGPQRGDNPFDLTSNVHLMAGHDAYVARQVEAAMKEAGIEPGQPVMLTGHSQGGIVAASLASDPGFLSRYSVESVVTGGSPIARFDIPPSVSVLAIEHDQDVVPMLDGRENPDRPNVVTVNRDVQASETTVTTPYSGGQQEDIGVGPESMHDNRLYAQTGAMVDSSTDPSVRQWREDQQRFFTGDPTVTRWDVSAP